MSDTVAKRGYSPAEVEMHTRVALLEQDRERTAAILAQLQNSTAGIERSLAEMVVIERHNAQRHKETMDALGRAFTQIEAERDARQVLERNVSRWGGGLAVLIFLVGLGSQLIW